MLKYKLDFNRNIFNELEQSVILEDVINGRTGTTIVNNKDIIPLVRTTTKYNLPNQLFKSIHYEIIEKIKEIDDNIELNNALVEIYNDNYKKMKYHSDQLLDIQDNSYICIYSCYDNEIPTRILNIKNKETNDIEEIIMEHNSVIIFSTNTNKEYLHKILLDHKNKCNNRWFGLTFRLSKTLIEFRDNKPYFVSNNNELRIANLEDRNEFYKLRKKENSFIDFVYPELDYTISEGDLMPIY